MEAPRCRLCGVREWNHLCERVDRLAVRREAEVVARETVAERELRKRRARAEASAERMRRMRAQREAQRERVDG